MWPVRGGGRGEGATRRGSIKRSLLPPVSPRHRSDSVFAPAPAQATQHRTEPSHLAREQQPPRRGENGERRDRRLGGHDHGERRFRPRIREGRQANHYQGGCSLCLVCSIGFYCLVLRECSGCFSVRLLLSSGPCLQ